MSYQPQYSISPKLLTLVEEIAALRERIQGAAIELSWIPALQKDTRTRNVHASTAIEGNPLSLKQVQMLEDGQEIQASSPRSTREITNYFEGLKYIEKNALINAVRHEDVFELHAILAGDVMDQGEAGRYRSISVKVGNHFPPAADDVSPLMWELLEWWNTEAKKLSPILSSAILHFRFEDIHPFADGNGRCGRALALWDLYRRGFDSHHIFSVDEYYWEDRPAYYRALEQVRVAGGDLSVWLEYCAEGLRQTLENVWLRIKSFQSHSTEKITLNPKQEHLLQLLRDHGSMAPAELWEALDLSKQGTLNLLNPLIEAGIVKKVGTRKTGRYTLSSI